MGLVGWGVGYFFTFIYSGFNSPPSVWSFVLLAEPFAFLLLCALSAFGVFGKRLLRLVAGLALLHALVIGWLLIAAKVRGIPLQSDGPYLLSGLVFTFLCLAMCRNMLRDAQQRAPADGPRPAGSARA